MLAMADRKGRVWASLPGLANRARVTLEEAETAITLFLSPDKYSRTTDNEGRRIEPIDGGWRLLNHEKYRSIRDEEVIKESKRKYINTRREVERDVENVDRCRHNAEADTDAESLKTKIVLAPGLDEDAWNAYLKYRKAIKKPIKPASIAAAQKKLAGFGQDQMNVVTESVSNGWIGIFPPKTNGGHHAKPSKLQQAANALRAADERAGRHYSEAAFQDVSPEPGLRAITRRSADGDPGHD